MTSRAIPRPTRSHGFLTPAEAQAITAQGCPALDTIISRLKYRLDHPRFLEPISERPASDPNS